MPDKDLLDHIPTQQKKTSLLQKLALAIEIGAWAFIIFRLSDFLSYETRSSLNSIGSMFGKSAAPLYAYFFLIVFYFLCAILIFRSLGWKQHVFAECCGLIISAYLLWVIFALESSPFAKELLLAVFLAALLSSVLALILSFKNKDKQVLNFLLGIFIRMGMIALLTGFCLH